MISVTISEPLAQAAISQVKVCHRSIDSQIDHWAKIGKIAEENPDLSFEFINTALQARNEVLTGKTELYSFDEALEDAELLAIVKARENEPTIKVLLDDLRAARGRNGKN
jgi:ParD-like antitoxin of type II bacterial toxin-antitoxin system